METNDLLRFALHVVGRVAIPPEQLREIVDTGPKQVKAFNLCDGTRSQSEIAAEAGLDQGNLSRAIARWRQHGALLVSGSGKAAVYLHVYPLPPSAQEKSKNGRQRGSAGKRSRKGRRKH